MSFWQLLKCEIKAVMSNPVVVLTAFGGVLFYGFLYPLPYQQQVPREQAIAIVNFDHSALSYRLERMVDATPQVKISQRADSLEQAKHALLQGDVSGMLVIPKDFYKQLMLGQSPTLAFAADASYFLVYGTVVEGLAKAAGTLAANASVTRLLADGTPLSQASGQYAPTRLNLKPTFNPQMGYLNYVVPAVFVLILQQTLVMASGLMVGSQKQAQGYWQQVTPWRLLTARCLVFCAIYALLTLYYFGVRFAALDIHRLAQIGDLLTFALPFWLSASLMGIWLGAITPRREWVSIVVLLSSMPLVFCAGFIWPVESMPSLIVTLSQIFPSSAAITGFLRLNQMGAEWRHVATPYVTLWIQVIFWGILAQHRLKYALHQHR